MKQIFIRHFWAGLILVSTVISNAAILTGNFTTLPVGTNINLTDVEKAKIFFSNAKRILNLPDEIDASSAVAA